MSKDIEQIMDLNDELAEKDKEIERLNNELELQNIEMGREIERLNNNIARANNFIDQEIMYIVKPEDYNKIEMLQDILNENKFGSDKE